MHALRVNSGRVSLLDQEPQNRWDFSVPVVAHSLTRRVHQQQRFPAESVASASSLKSFGFSPTVQRPALFLTMRSLGKSKTPGPWKNRISEVLGASSDQFPRK